MSYPFSIRSQAFGSLAVDRNHNSLAGAVGSGIQVTDNTPVTALTSPITVTTGTTLNVPTNAIKCIISTSAGLRISNSVTDTGYFVLNSGNSVVLEIARQASIYLIEDSGSAIVNFLFILI